jgi:hypothetical protein
VAERLIFPTSLTYAPPFRQSRVDGGVTHEIFIVLNAFGSEQELLTVSEGLHFWGNPIHSDKSGFFWLLNV